MLTSSDDKHTFDTEEEVERKEESGDKVSELFDHDRRILNQQGNLSLHEQLRLNREREELAKREEGNPFKPPRGLDSEEIGFLEDEEKKTRKKEAQQKAEEIALLADFKQKSHQLDKRFQDAAPTELDVDEQRQESEVVTKKDVETEVVVGEVVVKKKRKHKKRSKDKKSKKSKVSLVSY